MKASDFNASLKPLRPLFNPEKRGKMRPRDIRRILEDSTDLLAMALDNARRHAGTPKSNFLYNLVFTCEKVSKELQPADRSEDFGEWELFMNEQANRELVNEDAELVLPESTKPARGQKRRAEEELHDDDASRDDDPDVPAPAKSEAPKVLLPPLFWLSLVLMLTVQTSTSKGVPSAKNPGLKKVPKPNFDTTAAKDATTRTAIVKPQSRKQIKTQTGSVKDEPSVDKGESSRAARAQSRAVVKDEGDSGTSKGKGKSAASTHQAEITAVSTYSYIEKVPVPIHKDEFQALLQAPPEPAYGCAQCSSSVQSADCVFQGWGKRCSVCQIGKKSLCSYRAEPLQRYAARRELALLAESTPEHIRTALNRATSALQIFETNAHAAAQAARYFRNELDDALRICYNAVRSEGADALKDIVFEDPGLLSQVKAVLDEFDHPVRPSPPVLPVVESPARKTAPLPASNLKPGPSQASGLTQPNSLVLRPEDEFSGSDSPSSAVEPLLAPSGADSESDAALSAPLPDLDFIEDEADLNVGSDDEQRLEALAAEVREEATQKLRATGQTFPDELPLENPPRRTRKKKSPKKGRSNVRI
ncbi:uncharacterized protein ARMOST_15796 [Armillaria ostoyae]|uniref:Uncharacterized protein n=1 Tax=Armillaria ostoyae TaxID=47428 RepID=A0A284RUG3_ARMOS|nr:uncharacterized protein ARMOST_15796 [Armillaria ostoyae]